MKKALIVVSTDKPKAKELIREIKAFLKENAKLADTIEGLLLDTLHGDDNLEENENQKNDSPEKSVEQLFEIDEDGVVLD